MRSIAFAACLMAAGSALALPAPQAAPATAEAQAQPERLIGLEGVQNARDIGGYRTADGRTVKWGVIFRTASLEGLTLADMAVLSGHNLQAVHDLRSVEERQSEPTEWTGDAAPRFVAHDYTMDMAGFAQLFQGEVTEDRARATFEAMYPEILKMQQPQHRALFADLLTGEGAVLYHCTAGKDRTGVATALILSALGVPRETILQDYELSNRYYDPEYGQDDAHAGDDPMVAAFLSLPEDVRAVFMGVDADYLQAVFDHIDQNYGSVEAYLDREIGVDAADIARLQDLYLV